MNVKIMTGKHCRHVLSEDGNESLMITAQPGAFRVNQHKMEVDDTTKTTYDRSGVGIDLFTAIEALLKHPLV